MATRPAAWMSWSSGKDSTLALHHARLKGEVEVVGLLTTVNAEFQRVAMHGVRRELLDAQAAALGLPLHVVELPWPCSNEVYEQRMSAAVQAAEAAGVETMVFGDLFLEDVRRYRERALEGTKLRPLFPLWGRPTRAVAGELLELGTRAVLTCVDTAQAPADLAGRWYDAGLIAELPPGVDPCGEHGEFHTVVVDGPGFASPVAVTIGEIAASALDLDAVMKLVVERAGRLTGANAAVVELAEGDEMVYHVCSGGAAAHVGLRLRADSSLSGLCVREGQTLHCRDAQLDDRVDLEACRRVGAISMLCVPLGHNGRVIGVLKVYDPRPNAFDAEDVSTLDLLSGVIAAHMAHASDFAEQSYASRHDALTGLPNRRALDERLLAEVARANRHGIELTLGLLDLNRFKQVNDTLGHPAGDAVLRAVAGNLSGRVEDGAYRLGGDEFALVLVETGAEGAAAVMGPVARTIAADPYCRGVGASWGLAAHRNGEQPASLLARADVALYDAKHQLAA